MRLIDADAFSAFIKKAVAEQGYEVLRICDTLTVADVLNSVCAELDGTGLEGFKNAPPVDAVPVVMCKDCKYYERSMGYCERLGITINDEDYCSFGERKDGDHHED